MKIPKGDRKYLFGKISFLILIIMENIPSIIQKIKLDEQQQQNREKNKVLNSNKKNDNGIKSLLFCLDKFN